MPRLRSNKGVSTLPYEPLKIPALRRLARRGGIKRLSLDTYGEARHILKSYLKNVVSDTVNITSYSKRKTVTASDVMYALTRNNSKLYS
jgi:histone H4